VGAGGCLLGVIPAGRLGAAPTLSRVNRWRGRREREHRSPGRLDVWTARGVGIFPRGRIFLFLQTFFFLCVAGGCQAGVRTGGGIMGGREPRVSKMWGI
jgi:predicted metal-dependent hydrolase